MNPTGALVQTVVRFVVENVPEGHKLHEDAPATENRPGGHSMHDVAPELGEYCEFGVGWGMMWVGRRGCVACGDQQEGKGGR